MRFLPGVDEVVFLEVGQLGEALATGLTDERTLAGVGAEVDLQVGQLAERLEAHVALVVHLPVALPQWVGQGAEPSQAVRLRLAEIQHLIRLGGEFGHFSGNRGGRRGVAEGRWVEGPRR